MAPVLCEDMPYAEAGGVAGWGNDSGTRGGEGCASACFAHISLVVFSQYSLITSSCHIWYSPLHLGFGGRRRRRRKDQYILVTERVTPDAATERGHRTRSGVPVDSCESLGVAPRVTAPVSCVCVRDEELVRGPFLKAMTSPLPRRTNPKQSLDSVDSHRELSGSRHGQEGYIL